VQLWWSCHRRLGPPLPQDHPQQLLQSECGREPQARAIGERSVPCPSQGQVRGLHRVHKGIILAGRTNIYLAMKEI